MIGKRRHGIVDGSDRGYCIDEGEVKSRFRSFLVGKCLRMMMCLADRNSNINVNNDFLREKKTRFSYRACALSLIISPFNLFRTSLEKKIVRVIAFLHLRVLRGIPIIRQNLLRGNSPFRRAFSTLFSTNKVCRTQIGDPSCAIRHTSKLLCLISLSFSMLDCQEVIRHWETNGIVEWLTILLVWLFIDSGYWLEKSDRFIRLQTARWTTWRYTAACWHGWSLSYGSAQHTAQVPSSFASYVGSSELTPPHTSVLDRFPNSVVSIWRFIRFVCFAITWEEHAMRSGSMHLVS